MNPTTIAVRTAATCTLFALWACQGQPLSQLPGERGTLIGAAAGATAAQVIGDDVGALGTVLATVAGGLLGKQLIGQQEEKVEQALAQNQPVTLQAQGTNQVTIRPVRSYTQDGQLCREYVVSAAAQQRQAVACRISEGQWKLVRAS